MAITLLTKPKYRTSTSGEIIQTFEVVWISEGQDATTASVLTPRPAMGFEQDDAINKLAAMLKENRLTVDDFLEQLGQDRLGMRLQVIDILQDFGAQDGYRKAMPMQHDAIVAHLRKVYDDVNPQELRGVEARIPTAQVDPETTSRMQTYTNSANQQAETAHHRPSPLDKLPKERRIITVNQGGSDQREALQALTAQLTPENIPAGGLVITMGKNGPKILKTASARTDEEEVAADSEALETGGSINTHARSVPAGEITINRDPRAGMPTPKVASEEAPKPAPKVRTMTEEQLATQAQSVDITHKPAILDQAGFETSLGAEDAAALADQQMGTVGLNVGPVDMKEAVGATVRDADHHTQLGEEIEVGGRAIKKSTVVRHDRGGTRPKGNLH